MAHFGLARGAQPSEDGFFEVWQENLETVRLFCSLSHTWRRDSMSGIFLGMDYAQVAAVLWIRRAKERERLFEGLQEMEVAALEELRALSEA